MDSDIEFHKGKVYLTDLYLSKSNQYTSAPKKVVEPGSILLSEKLLSLFEVEDIDSLKSKIKEATNPNYQYQMSFGWVPWITDYIDPDKIGICR